MKCISMSFQSTWKRNAFISHEICTDLGFATQFTSLCADELRWASESVIIWSMTHLSSDKVVASWTDCRLPIWVCLARLKSFSSLLRHQGCWDAHRFKSQADISNHLFPASLSAWTAWVVLRRSWWGPSRCSPEIQDDVIYSGCSAVSKICYRYS